MPSVNFMAQWADRVQAGQKRQTIRARRIAAGEVVYAYTGMRTKACRKLGAWRVKESLATTLMQAQAYVDNRLLSEEEREQLAIADGFASYAEMFAFFCELKLTFFQGWLMKW